MDLLILDEQTTPKDSFDSDFRFSSGAIPGGVIGRGRRVDMGSWGG